MIRLFLAALLCGLTIPAYADERPPPPGLAKVMAEGAGRAVKPTCADVRAVVAWIGEAKAEQAARSAGASEAQIARGKKCLTSSSR